MDFKRSSVKLQRLHAVVRRAAYGEATSDFPVSLLTSHPDINLKITEFVAALD